MSRSTLQAYSLLQLYKMILDTMKHVSQLTMIKKLQLYNNKDVTKSSVYIILYWLRKQSVLSDINQTIICRNSSMYDQLIS